MAEMAESGAGDECSGGITIRIARPDEYETVGVLTVAAFRADGLTDDEYETELRDVAQRAAHADVLVATDRSGQILGTVTFITASGEIAGPDEAEFRMLGVAPAARGRGIGELLVRECMERARAQGFRGLVLSTLPAMHAAHRLYERLGFQRVPPRDWTPVPDFTLLVYAREL